MNKSIAHNIENTIRTDDINTFKNVDFESMLLSKKVLEGLTENGFKKPSPIQLKSIPMGRCGYDLILQAKSGTGKTAVFVITALEMIDLSLKDLQVLILAPTREIAVQIHDVIKVIGCKFSELKVEYFIGGTNIKDDLKKLENCHIAVGAPGRVKHLIKKCQMKVANVKLFVLDEADKLMSKDDKYQKDINFIYNKLKLRKQVIASSATYLEGMELFLRNYMISPILINPSSDIQLLIGIRQFITPVKSHLTVIQQNVYKNEELIRILKSIAFTQCLVFSNYQSKAETISNFLSREGWPSIYICGSQNQGDRLHAIDSLKEFKCRILSTTDLVARGIDASNVDLVINYDIPYNTETYLHRMGRAGRYGSYGICVSIVAEDEETDKFQKLINKIYSKSYCVHKLPENIPQDIWTCDLSNFDKIYSQPDETDGICDTLNDLSVTVDVNNESVITKQLNSDIKNTISATVTVDNSDNKNKVQQTVKDTSSDENKNVDSFSSEELIAGNLEIDKNCESYVGSLLNSFHKQEQNKTIEKDENDHKEIANKTMEKTPNQNDLLCSVAKLINEDTDVNPEFEFDVDVLLKSIKNQKKETEIKNTNQETAISMDTENSQNDSKMDTKKKIKKSKNKKAKTNVTFPDIRWEEVKSDEYNSEAKIFQENNSNMKMKDDDNICTCSEDLICDAFNFAVSKTEDHWNNKLCQFHRTEGTPDDQEEQSNYSNCKYEEENSYYEEDYDFMDDNEYNYEQEGDYQFLENDDYLNEFYTEEAESDIVPDEDIFVKAFNYALRDNKYIETIEINDEGVETAELNPEEEVCGYAVNFNYNYENEEMITEQPETDYSFSFAEYDSVDVYESMYEKYNDLLVNNGPYFQDRQQFEKWFQNWQNNVSAVRNYIHQDVFMKEKNRTD